MLKEGKQDYLPAEINGKSNPLLRERYPDNWIHIVGRGALSLYMYKYHHLKIKMPKPIPEPGTLFYANHNSHLTTIALMVGDP